MYPRSAISLLPSFHCYNGCFSLDSLGLREGDCVEVTTTTGMIQNQVSVEEDGEVVVHFTNVLPPRPLFNDLVWATVVEFHIGRDFHVR